MKSRRPLRTRVWFYRPGDWLPGWRLVTMGGDEHDWHTVVVGSRVTGAVVFATRLCPGTGKCSEMAGYINGWTPDRFGGAA